MFCCQVEVVSAMAVEISMQVKEKETQTHTAETNKSKIKSKWKNALAGTVAGMTTITCLHPLDVVRTRFQVNDGRRTQLPLYRNTVQALYTIARAEGLRGLYAGFYPSVLGSGSSWGLYFFFYSKAKHRYEEKLNKPLGPALHLVSAAEAGTIVSLLLNPVWLIKTRLQLQAPVVGARQPYLGLVDAVKTILRDEGWHAFYKGLGPSLLLVSHGAIQFMIYEESRKLLIREKAKRSKQEDVHDDKILNSFDYSALGALSKIFAALLTYPYQVVRARVQQRPNINGLPMYRNSYHAFIETLRFEGISGFYKGIVPNLLRNVPASSITFLVYENLLRFLK